MEELEMEELEQQILACGIGGKRKRKALKVLRRGEFIDNPFPNGFVDSIIWDSTPLRSSFWARLDKFHYPNERSKY